MATFEEQSNTVVGIINDRAGQVDSLRATVEALIAQVQSINNSMVSNLAGLGLTFDISGVNVTYVPPTAAAPTVPDNSTVSIGDAEWDRIFALDAARQAAIGAGELYQAQNEARSRGRAIPSWISQHHVDAAMQRASDRISASSLTNIVEHAKASREDIPRLVELSIQLYKEQWTNQIQSETSRLGYQQLALAKATQPNIATAEYNLKVAGYQLDTSFKTLMEQIQVYAQLTQAFITGSAVDLGSRVAMEIGQIKYNPTIGEVVQYPA